MSGGHPPAGERLVHRVPALCGRHVSRSNGSTHVPCVQPWGLLPAWCNSVTSVPSWHLLECHQRDAHSGVHNDGAGALCTHGQLGTETVRSWYRCQQQRSARMRRLCPRYVSRSNGSTHMPCLRARSLLPAWRSRCHSLRTWNLFKFLQSHLRLRMHSSNARLLCAHRQFHTISMPP